MCAVACRCAGIEMSVKMEKRAHKCVDILAPVAARGWEWPLKARNEHVPDLTIRQLAWESRNAYLTCSRCMAKGDAPLLPLSSSFW
jgi:hypothetical protein